MIKKTCLISLLVGSLLPMSLYAVSQHTLKIHVQFDSESYGMPLHFNNTVKIDPQQKENRIVMTQSEVVNNFPVTVALVVKAENVKNNQVTLQFNLLNYGFKQSGGIYTQPKLILAKGQTGEIKNSAFILKATAN
jgi:hypothetical protein